jgi:cbb3-type cytochrome oxidase subunit 3
MDEIAPPFGTFMRAVPHWGFIVIHSTLILVALWLSRKGKRAGYAAAAPGFLLFVLAELSYITYHAGLTHFLFAHTIAEVLDALALVTIARGLPFRSPGT